MRARRTREAHVNTKRIAGKNIVDIRIYTIHHTSSNETRQEANEHTGHNTCVFVRNILVYTCPVLCPMHAPCVTWKSRSRSGCRRQLWAKHKRRTSMFATLMFRSQLIVAVIIGRVHSPLLVKRIFMQPFVYQWKAGKLKYLFLNLIFVYSL